jgi:hypothetical protein
VLKKVTHKISLTTTQRRTQYERLKSLTIRAATFKKIDPVVYYVLAKKGDMDNGIESLLS